MLSEDVKALAHTAHEHGYTMQVIEAVERVNERQKSIVFDKLQLALGDLRGKTVAVWGLAFKPETDDMREAPALVVIDRLLEAGATVRAYDPVAANESRRSRRRARLSCRVDVRSRRRSRRVALITEWKQFRMPDWTLLRSAMRDNIIVDGRNILDKEEALNAGFRYYGMREITGAAASGMQSGRLQEAVTVYNTKAGVYAPASCYRLGDPTCGP